MLEIRVLDIDFRIPYVVNNTGPGKGLLPHLLKEPVAKLIRVDLERRVALFSQDIQIPLNPLMGIMAVSAAHQPWYGVVHAAWPLGRQYRFEIHRNWRIALSAGF